MRMSPAVAERPFVITRAVVVDNWAIVRRGLQGVLANAGVATDAAVATASEGFAALADSSAGLMVLGVFSDQNQRDAVGRAVALGRRVLVLSTLAHQSAVVELYRAGALAVVPRAASDREFATAVQHVLAGDAYVASALVNSLFTRSAPVRSIAPLRFGLTSRERDVLNLLAAGRSNREIANALCIGTETVKTHVGNLYAKLDVGTRPEAVRAAIHHGLI